MAVAPQPSTQTARPRPLGLAMAISAMAAAVALANVSMQHAIGHWLTWGTPAISLTYMVTELTNRRYGAHVTRRVVWVGFAIAVALSAALAPWRIALASGCAFLASQMLDIAVFARLRHRRWWQAPLAASMAASALDTAVFFALAFVGTAVTWWRLALGDLAFKVATDACLLVPFRLIVAGSLCCSSAPTRRRSLGA